MENVDRQPLAVGVIKAVVHIVHLMDYLGSLHLFCCFMTFPSHINCMNIDRDKALQNTSKVKQFPEMA